MEIKDNFSIFNLFLDKKVKIYINQQSFYVKVPTIKEFSLNDKINATYHMWILDTDQMEKVLPLKVENPLDFVEKILFQFGMYKEYSTITETFKEVLQFFIPNIVIDYKKKQLIVDDIIITNEV